MTAYTIDLNPIIPLTDEQFDQLCRTNPEIKFERNSQGEIIVMSPTGGETGNQNVEMMIEFGIWNRNAKLGKLFDSSTCFKLPNGANRSPEVAWIKTERWILSPQNKRQIFPQFLLTLFWN